MQCASPLSPLPLPYLLLRASAGAPTAPPALPSTLPRPSAPLPGRFSQKWGGGGVALTLKAFPHLLLSATQVQKNFMVTLASDDLGSGVSMPERSSRSTEQGLFISYESKSGTSVFTEAGVKAMYEMDDIILQHADWPKYCFLDYTSAESITCSTPPTVKMMLNGATGQAAIDDRLRQIAGSPEELFRWGFLLDKDFGKDGSIVATIAQSGFFLGLPLKGYTSPGDDPTEQAKPGDSFLIDVSESLLGHLDMKAPWMMRSRYEDKAKIGDLDVAFWGFPVQINEWQSMQAKDISWVFFCLVSVGGYMYFHTGSGLYAAVGMTEIFLSMGVAGFFYRAVFQATYFAFMHILVLFVILGIGADDVFVFLDAFHQAESELQSVIAEPTLSQRMEYTAMRASKAIFATSFTTAIAFFATAITPILPIHAFGIFAGLVILSLYAINVFVMPPTIAVFERYLRGKTLLEVAGFRRKGKGEEDGPKEVTHSAEQGKAGMRPFEAFLYNRYHAFLSGPVKYVIVVVFVGLMAGGVYLASGLKPPEDSEQWFPSGHMHWRYVGDKSKKFKTASEDSNSFKVVLAYGLKEVDLSKTGKWSPDDLGSVVYDDAFEFQSAGDQQHIAETCRLLRSRKCSEVACSGGVLVKGGKVNCFIEDFYEWSWLGAEDPYCGEAKCKSYDIDNPLSGAEFLKQLHAFSSSSLASIRYPGHIGFESAESDRLKFVEVVVPTSIVPPVAPKDFKPVQEAWDSFMDERNKAGEKSAPGVARGFAAGQSLFWLWSRTTEALVKSLWIGIAIAFPLAFIVIAASTLNIWTAFLCILTIFGIITTVMGLGARGMLNWSLGTAEAVAAVIIIGFSVDYCVHLANAYTESEASARSGRVRDALGTIGISITAGAVTTFLSGVWLWGCCITFFNKFAFLIVGTVISSYLWSMLFFTSVAIIAGPMGSFGSLKFIPEALQGLRARASPAAAGTDQPSQG